VAGFGADFIYYTSKPLSSDSESGCLIWVEDVGSGSQLAPFRHRALWLVDECFKCPTNVTGSGINVVYGAGLLMGVIFYS
jgi:hypothetical protein